MVVYIVQMRMKRGYANLCDCTCRWNAALYCAYSFTCRNNVNVAAKETASPLLVDAIVSSTAAVTPLVSAGLTSVATEAFHLQLVRMTLVHMYR